MGGQRYALGTAMLFAGLGFLYMAFTPKGQEAWQIIVTGVGGYQPPASGNAAAGTLGTSTDSKQRSTTPTPQATKPPTGFALPLPSQEW